MCSSFAQLLIVFLCGNSRGMPLNTDYNVRVFFQNLDIPFQYRLRFFCKGGLIEIEMYVLKENYLLHNLRLRFWLRSRYWFRFRFRLRLHLSSWSRRTKGLCFRSCLPGHSDRLLSMACRIFFIGSVLQIFSGFEFHRTFPILAGLTRCFYSPICLWQFLVIVPVHIGIFGRELLACTSEHHAQGEYGNDDYEHSLCCYCLHLYTSFMNFFHILTMTPKDIPLYSYSPFSHSLCLPLSQRSSPLNDPNQHHNDCDDKQNMNESTNRVTAD